MERARSRRPPADWLEPVERSLDASEGPVEVFFRDDDGGWGDERLLALLDLFAEHRLPLDLALIPAALDVGIARELGARSASGEPRLGLHQHGFTHANHEREGRKCEFGPSRPRAAQRQDIEAGMRRLEDLLGDGVEPIFTPPWNRCTEDTAHCLVALGFRVLSREARAERFGVPGLSEVPVHVDWFAKRDGVRLEPAAVGLRLAEVIASPGPSGIMFHHALMEGAEMRRAAELVALLATHEHVRSRRILELAELGEQRHIAADHGRDRRAGRV